MEIITVKQLNAYIKSLIEGDALLYNVTVKGEISNLTNHYKSGHFYFSLKVRGRAHPRRHVPFKRAEGPLRAARRHARARARARVGV